LSHSIEIYLKRMKIGMNLMISTRLLLDNKLEVNTKLHFHFYIIQDQEV